MALQDRLQQEIKQAMLAKDADRLTALRSLKSALGYILIEKKKNLYYSETALETISFAPYSRSRIGGRGDIARIAGGGGDQPLLFATRFLPGPIRFSTRAAPQLLGLWLNDDTLIVEFSEPMDASNHRWGQDLRRSEARFPPARA